MQEDENSFLPSARSLLIHVRVRASVLVRCIAVRVTRVYDALTCIWFICLHELDLRLFCLRLYVCSCQALASLSVRVSVTPKFFAYV